MSTSIATSALVFIQPSVELNTKRRAFCAPEITEYPDELFYEWAEGLLERMGSITVDLIKHATDADMQTLLTFFTGDTAWPSHRRAFFNELHSRAQELEVAGLAVASRAFVEFYRERYRPSYIYILERGTAAAAAAAAAAFTPIEVVVHPPGTTTPLMTPLAPILESSQEMLAEEEGGTPLN